MPLKLPPPCSSLIISPDILVRIQLLVSTITQKVSSLKVKRIYSALWLQADAQRCMSEGMPKCKLGN